MMSGSCSSQSINRICRVYAVMLGAYPKAFRNQFGCEMTQVFRDGCRAAVTNNAVLRFVLLVFWDWLRSSLRERLASRRTIEIQPGQPLIRGWWLLALCGIFDAMCAGMHLFMLSLFLNPYGSLGMRRFGLLEPVWYLSLIALVAGACAFANGLWNFGRGNSWLVFLHGLALSSFGLIGISPLVKGPLGFRPISLLFVLMAVSMAAFTLATAQRGGGQDPWFWTASAAASLLFACSFIIVGFGWVRLRSPNSYWIWMSSYFAFTALCMLRVSLRLHAVGPSQVASPPARA
jgi:hypothetical protein